jgi:hypothetical protein
MVKNDVDELIIKKYDNGSGRFEIGMALACVNHILYSTP